MEMKFVNSKRIPWYLHKKMNTIGRNKVTVPTYFFKKTKGEGYCALPVGYKVIETRNGLPFIKKL
jgi:hypothetical protein